MEQSKEIKEVLKGGEDLKYPYSKVMNMQDGTEKVTSDASFTDSTVIQINDKINKIELERFEKSYECLTVFTNSKHILSYVIGRESGIVFTKNKFDKLEEHIIRYTNHNEVKEEHICHRMVIERVFKQLDGSSKGIFKDAINKLTLRDLSKRTFKHEIFDNTGNTIKTINGKYFDELPLVQSFGVNISCAKEEEFTYTTYIDKRINIDRIELFNIRGVNKSSGKEINKIIFKLNYNVYLVFESMEGLFDTIKYEYGKPGILYIRFFGRGSEYVFKFDTVKRMLIKYCRQNIVKEGI